MAQTFIGGKWRGDYPKIVDAWDNGDLYKWLDEAGVSYDKSMDEATYLFPKFP